MYDSVIIGGGFFGLYLADYLANKRNQKVLLLEKENGLMTKASLHNQARIHNGYHYPRSITTALRSRMSFPIFVEEFQEAVVNDFEKIYAIGKPLGKINDKQFEQFCHNINAQLSIASNELKELFNPQLVAQVYQTKEYAFNSKILRELILNRLEKSSNLEIKTNSPVEKIESNNTFIVQSHKNSYNAKSVYNCTYSGINQFEKSFGEIPLKHELTEICLVSVPHEFKNLGITIMCGPYFSLMPFPAIGKNLHSFTHVRYTPHLTWHKESETPTDYAKKSAFRYMLKDASRFIPLLSHLKLEKSLWETKTVLPSSERSDSRPILFKTHHGMRNYHCILGGKIDNVYDMVKIIDDNFDEVFRVK